MSADLPDYAKQKPKLKWQLPLEGAWPTAVAFVADGKRLVAANQAGQIFLWDLAADESPAFKPSGDRTAPGLAPSRQFVGHTNGVSRLAAAADGRTFYSASLDHTVRVWDVAAAATGKADVVVDADSRERDAKKSGKKSGDAQPGVTVETVAATAVLEGHEDWVTALALSRDGKRLVSGDTAAQVIVWDLAAMREAGRIAGLPWNWIVALALSPDGRTVAVSEFRYKRDDFDIPAAALRLFDVAAEREMLDLLKLEFPKYERTTASYEAAQTWRKFVCDGLVSADVSADGKLLALGQGGETDTGKVPLFDMMSGKLLRTISGHRYGVCDVRFSGDGRFVFSVGRDTMLRICTTVDGKEVAALGSSRGGQFKDWLSAVAVSPDGRTLAAADISGLIHVWSI